MLSKSQLSKKVTFLFIIPKEKQLFSISLIHFNHSQVGSYHFGILPIANGLRIVNPSCPSESIVHTCHGNPLGCLTTLQIQGRAPHIHMIREMAAGKQVSEL